MPAKKLLLDTNVLVDYLQAREINLEATRLLLAAGKVGEFDLWVTTSQLTDLIYILSGGGKPRMMPEVLERLKALFTFVNLYSLTGEDCLATLDTTWSDPEDALIYRAAQSLCADAIITNNAEDFETDAIKVCDSAAFFRWLAEKENLVYSQVKF